MQFHLYIYIASSIKFMTVFKVSVNVFCYVLNLSYFFLSYKGGRTIVSYFFIPQGDGSEEVVACSWDGQTYLVNYKRDVVRFQFPEKVAAFCAGETEHHPRFPIALQL